MGQKVNPVAFRCGVMETWKSRWYASKGEFAQFLLEDKKIRDFIKKHPTQNYKAAGIDRLRSSGRVTKLKSHCLLLVRV